MAVDAPSIFAQVIQDHLELKRRNCGLEHEMPLGKYMHDDPFENHPLFKTEEQARIKETMDGVGASRPERDVPDRPTTEDTFIDAPQDDPPLASLEQPTEAPRRSTQSRTSARTRVSGRARATSTGACVGLGLGSARQPTSRIHGWLSRAQRLSSMRFTGQKVDEPAKSSMPAANTFAPAAVS